MSTLKAQRGSGAAAQTADFNRIWATAVAGERRPAVRGPGSCESQFPTKVKKRRLLGCLFWLLRIEGKPRDHPVPNLAQRLVVIGLPASERGPPNAQLASKLGLGQPRLDALPVDMLTDSLRESGHGRPHSMKRLAPVGP